MGSTHHVYLFKNKLIQVVSEPQALWPWILSIVNYNPFIHSAYVAANLNSGYSKYAKVARVHYFCTIALRTPLRPHERRVHSPAQGIDSSTFQVI